MLRQTLDTLILARRFKSAVALVTDTASGDQALVTTDGESGALSLGDETRAEVRNYLRTDRSGPLDATEGALFVHSHNPPLRLVVVGAVHIAQRLAPMAVLTGYDVVIIDPRRAFASEDRFPGVKLVHQWPDDALEEIAPDHRTAIVTLTHDPKLDDPALALACRSPAFYIGSLGSKRTHAARLERLAEAGLSDAERARVHGPIGLDIGAASPAEIAIAILAEITEALRRGDSS